MMPQPYFSEQVASDHQRALSEQARIHRLLRPTNDESGRGPEARRASRRATSLFRRRRVTTWFLRGRTLGRRAT
jgi:hypothetical protein